MTAPRERFTVLTGGSSSEERAARLSQGADRLAQDRGHNRLVSRDRFLLGVAAACMSFGVSLILLGWLGAAHSTLIEEQVPYLISGGLVGVALSIIGAVCLLAHWLTVLIREERAREVQRRQDHAELMTALRALSSATDTQGADRDGSARSSRPERPIRRAPRGS